MIKSACKWLNRRYDARLARSLAQELNVSALTAVLLLNRGITNARAAHSFLNPTIADLHEPGRMKGMKEAVRRIMGAVARGEKIIILGDYDNDGVLATVMLKKAISMIGGSVTYYIPDRLTDGYGLREDVMDRARADSCGLAISVDTGIRAHKVIAHARAIGLDIIVTDHHLPLDGPLPEATAILNPRQPGCSYPEKNLAGVGVAFKLAHALLAEAGRGRHVKSFVKLAAIGTIADVVPLTGENRVITRCGLEQLGETVSTGLHALLDSCELTGQRVRASDIAFKVAPKINAMGRTGSVAPVVDLFDTTSDQQASKIVKKMTRRNKERQAAEADVMKLIRAEIDCERGLAQTAVAVIAGEGWHRGVIGIAASRIVERLARPAVVISIDGEGMGHGSARSIPSYHVLAGMESCHELFERFGGHAQAAGCVIRREHIGELRRRLDLHARAALKAEDLIPKIEVDCEVPLSLVTLDTVAELHQIEPFGNGNPEPVFAATGVEIVSPPRILKDRHMKMVVRQGGDYTSCLWWGRADAADQLDMGDELNLAFKMSENTYRGRTEVQVELCDVNGQAA